MSCKPAESKIPSLFTAKKSKNSIRIPSRKNSLRKPVRSLRNLRKNFLDISRSKIFWILLDAKDTSTFCKRQRISDFQYSICSRLLFTQDLSVHAPNPKPMRKSFPNYLNPMTFPSISSTPDSNMSAQNTKRSSRFLTIRSCKNTSRILLVPILTVRIFTLRSIEKMRCA